MISIIPLETPIVEAWRAGRPDAYGAAPERAISDGSGVPCRHCLQTVPEGRDYMIVAHRPFDGLNPYTETGPIFVCADCARAPVSDALPPILTSPSYIVRGYSAEERIAYGTGGVIATEGVTARCRTLLSDPDIAFVHVRSASNNCFFFRVERD